MSQKINMCLNKCLSTIIFLLLVFLSTPSFAYHFFEANKGGCRWDKIGAGNVDFIVDKSSSTSIGDAVKAEMTTVFSTWNAPTTAKDVFGNVTTSTVDFTDTNFGTAWGKRRFW